MKLGDGVRLVMINDNGNGRSHCGLFEEGVKWLTGQIKEAKQSGDFILLAVHHPVIPPWGVYAHMVEYEMYGGYKDLWKLMCDEGVRVVFTGHVHEQNIRKYTDEQGRYFYNVATVSAVNAAGKMRKVTVDPDEGVCDVTSVGIESIKGFDPGDESAYEYLYHLNLPGRAEVLLPLAVKDFDEFLIQSEGSLPVDKLKAHPHLIRFAIKKLCSMKLKTAAKLGKAWRTLSKDEKEYAKGTLLIDVVYELLRHIYPGNAPYTPDTVEFKALMGVVRRADKLVRRFRIKKVSDMLPPGSTLAEAAEDFLYNNRTGDDDAIKINLK